MSTWLAPAPLNASNAAKIYSSIKLGTRYRRHNMDSVSATTNQDEGRIVLGSILSQKSIQTATHEKGNKYIVDVRHYCVYKYLCTVSVT